MEEKIQSSSSSKSQQYIAQNSELIRFVILHNKFQQNFEKKKQLSSTDGFDPCCTGAGYAY